MTREGLLARAAMRSWYYAAAIARALPMCILASALAVAQARAEERLSISPVQQQTPVWCWAAVGEMVLRYYDYPTINPAGNYQCGIVGSLGGACWASFGACITAIGNSENFSRALENYQDVAEQVFPGRGERFDVSIEGVLEPHRIIDEIEDGRPVIAGISPSGNGWAYPPGVSEHVALIVGYGDTDDGLTLLINDPMPYQLTPYDPYLAAGGRTVRPGQYRISYAAFVDWLGYKDSFELF